MSGSGPSSREAEDDVPRLDTDRYAFKRKIGRGGQGDVWLVHDTYLQLDMALKLLPRGDRSEEEELRFRDEAQRAIRISAINVIRLFDYNPDVPYLVMEYCDGGDLTRRIMSRRPAPVRQTLHTARQICEGLAALHEQPRPIVHRDLKPGNVLFQSGVPKIVDFGLSKELAGASSLTRTRGMMGTVSYASPEQLQDASKVDARTDLWAVGVLLQEMLTWERPFDRPGDDLVQVVLRIRTEPAFPSPFPLPDAVSMLIARALQKDPGARYGSAREMAGALAAAIAAVPADLVLPPENRIGPPERAAREAAELLERGDTQGALAAARRLRSVDAQGSLAGYWEPQARSAARGARAAGAVAPVPPAGEDSRIASIRSLIRGGQHREARRRLGLLLVDEPGNTMAEGLLSELKQEETRLRSELDRAHEEADHARADGDLARLVAVWERVLERVPEHPEVKAELAVARKELTLQARNDARNACDREASALAQGGDQERALRRWERFQSAYPDDEEASSRIRVLRELLDAKARWQAALDAARDFAIEALLRSAIPGVPSSGALQAPQEELASLLLRSGEGEEGALAAALRSSAQALDRAVSAAKRQAEERVAALLAEARAEASRWEAAHADWRSLDELEARVERLHRLDATLATDPVAGRLADLRRSAEQGSVAGEAVRGATASVEQLELVASRRLQEAQTACEGAIARLAGPAQVSLQKEAGAAAARDHTDALRDVARRAASERTAAAFRALAGRMRLLRGDGPAEDAEWRAVMAVARRGTPEEVAAALETLEHARLDRAQKEKLERTAREEAARRQRDEAERRAREEVEGRVKEAAERKAREEAEQQAREEAERKAEEEARKATAETEERARREEQERIVRQAAEQRAREEAARKQQEEAERRAKAEAEERVRQEAQALKAREEAEQEARRKAERRAKAEAELRVREEQALKAREEAEQEARREAERRAKAEAAKRVREEQALKEREEAEHPTESEAGERAPRPEPARDLERGTRFRRAALWTVLAGVAIGGWTVWRLSLWSPSTPEAPEFSWVLGKVHEVQGPDWEELRRKLDEQGQVPPWPLAQKTQAEAPKPPPPSKPSVEARVIPPTQKPATSTQSSGSPSLPGTTKTAEQPPVAPPKIEAPPVIGPAVDWVQLARDAEAAVAMPLGSVQQAQQAIDRLDGLLKQVGRGSPPPEERGLRQRLERSLRRAHDHRDIRLACDTWRRGYEEKNAQIVRSVYPAAPAERLGKSFQEQEAILVDLEIRSVDLSEEAGKAVVQCRGTVTFQTKAGGKRVPVPFAGFDLYRDARRWIISAVRWKQ